MVKGPMFVTAKVDQKWGQGGPASVL